MERPLPTQPRLQHKLHQEARRGQIAAKIARVGEVTFVDLAQEFAVSEMTIRRDIDLLEERGLARRVSGGAISRAGKSVEPPFSSRQLQVPDIKAALAVATVEQIAVNETVMLDSGTTALAVAKAIAGRKLRLSIVTWNIRVAIELANEPDTSVHITGGLMRPGEFSVVGPAADQAISQFNCNTFVMGVAGIDASRGITDYHEQEGSLKRLAIAAADRTIAVADKSKLGKVMLRTIANLAEIDTIVTDGDPLHPALTAAREAGVQVICTTEPDSISSMA